MTQKVLFFFGLQTCDNTIEIENTVSMTASGKFTQKYHLPIFSYMIYEF